MKFLHDRSLRSLVLSALLAMSLLPLALLGVAMYRSAADSLRKEAFERLEAVRTTTASSVERYFETLRQELLVTATSPLTLEAFTTLRDAWQELPPATEQDRQDLASYYATDFAPRLRQKTAEEIDMRPYAAALDPRGVLLQELYIRRNPEPVGSKHLLDVALDDSAYTRNHKQVHPIFRTILEKYGVYDIFLIDANSGTIVYTVFKEIDFGASLKSGPLASTNLAKAFNEAVRIGLVVAIQVNHHPKHGAEHEVAQRPHRRLGPAEHIEAALEGLGLWDV